MNLNFSRTSGNEDILSYYIDIFHWSLPYSSCLKTLSIYHQHVSALSFYHSLFRGIFYQGYYCSCCGTGVHKECLEVITICKISESLTESCFSKNHMYITSALIKEIRPLTMLSLSHYYFRSSWFGEFLVPCILSISDKLIILFHWLEPNFTSLFYLKVCRHLWKTL